MKRRHMNFGFLGIKLSSGHSDPWTVGKAHRTARIFLRDQGEEAAVVKVLTMMLRNIWLLVRRVTKHTEMLMHVIYRVCDVKCVSATYAVYELTEESSSCFKWV